MKELYLRMKDSVQCYLELLGMNLKSSLAFVADVWIDIVLFAVHQVAGLIFIWVIFTRTKTIGGWSLYEMVFLIGIQTLSTAFYRTLFSGLGETGMLVIKGEMDQLLTKPRHPLLIMSTRKTNINGLGSVIMGAALLLISAEKLELKWTLLLFSKMIVLVLCSNIIMISLFLAQGVFSFWFVRFSFFMESIHKVTEYSKYPLKIFNPAIRSIFYAAIPIAFSVYVPASVLLGKDGFSSVWFYLPILVCAGVMILSIMFFNYGMKHYNGAGS